MNKLGWNNIVRENHNAGRNILPDFMYPSGFVLFPNKKPFFSQQSPCITGTQQALSLILSYKVNIVGKFFTNPSHLATSHPIEKRLAEEISSYVHYLLTVIQKKFPGTNRVITIEDNFNFDSWHKHFAILGKEEHQSDSIDPNSRKDIDSKTMDQIATGVREFQNKLLATLESDEIAKALVESIKHLIAEKEKQQNK